MKSKNKNEKKHLPVFGIGPVYGAVCGVLTLLAVVFRDAECFKNGRIIEMRLLFTMIGVILIAGGILLWVKAVILDKIDDSIVGNRLKTTGSYAIVRNPIYSAIAIALTGILFLTGNLYFLVLPFVFWILMTVLVKNTEEKWLHRLYGREYEEYCRRVNRCIPWFPGK